MPGTEKWYALGDEIPSNTTPDTGSCSSAVLKDAETGKEMYHVEFLFGGNYMRVTPPKSSDSTIPATSLAPGVSAVAHAVVRPDGRGVDVVMAGQVRACVSDVSSSGCVPSPPFPWMAPRPDAPLADTINIPPLESHLHHHFDALSLKLVPTSVPQMGPEKITKKKEVPALKVVGVGLNEGNEDIAFKYIGDMVLKSPVQFDRPAENAHPVQSSISPAIEHFGGKLHVSVPTQEISRAQ
eukprot:CAMPEP_0196600052 /NCGR_PEP_ID=MMETSP1081-20130531/95184_1 /TAXON_ID=36882 /ORGANISM="Pyramimonas amylifera, Strain CCMP720" /LENGTH=238 /DNA_ID=CAMNT_0041925863 /DNA_START=103 /DNA_END=816 /DNA_ORIENTATION=-